MLGGSLGVPWGSWGVLRGSLGLSGRVLGAPWEVLGVLGGPWEVIGGTWRVVGEPLGGLRGCLGCLLGSSGGLGWRLWSHWGAYENVKKPLVFVVFSAFGSSRGAPSDVVFSFFLFPIVFTSVFFVFDRFFCFYDRIYVRFSVSDRFFGFFGRCFLHERIHGRDSAPRAYSRARFLSGLSGNQRKSAQTSGTSNQVRAQNYSKWNTRY